MTLNAYDSMSSPKSPVRCRQNGLIPSKASQPNRLPVEFLFKGSLYDWAVQDSLYKASVLYAHSHKLHFESDQVT